MERKSFAVTQILPCLHFVALLCTVPYHSSLLMAKDANIFSESLCMFVCFMAVSLVVFWTKTYQMVVFILVSICYIEATLHHSHGDLSDVTIEIPNMP